MNNQGFEYIRFVDGDTALLSELIWKVFLKYEAPEYSEEGINTFKEFIEPSRLSKEIMESRLRVYCCYTDASIVGVLAYRNETHISLLFVDEKYQEHGIAKELLRRSLEEIFADNEGVREITVNSSPYAEKIYQRMGFVAQDDMQEQNGIKYVPMKKTIK